MKKLNSTRFNLASRLGLISSLLIALLLGACSESDTSGPSEIPNRVLKVEKLDTKTREEILASLSAFGDAIPDIVAQTLVKYGAEIYGVEYLTTMPDGKEITASGTITLPVGAEKKLPYLSYQHGTVFSADEVSSVEGADGADGLISILTSSLGYIVFTPDYVGFGASADIIHPFVHKSVGLHSRDFIEAGIQILDSLEFAKNDSLFIMGYSEGGYATLSLQEALSISPVENATLIASAPMAGPYDMSGTMYDLMLNAETLAYPSYLPYALSGYNSIEPLWNDESSFFKAPFDSIMKSGIDKTLTGSDLNSIFPNSAELLLTDSAYTELTMTTDNDLVKVLRENDLTDFVPSVATNLFHCEDDDIIPFVNSQITYDNMLAAGAPVTLTKKSYGNHVECAGRIVLDAILWLNTY